MHGAPNAWFCHDGARSATRAEGQVGGSNLALGGATEEGPGATWPKRAPRTPLFGHLRDGGRAEIDNVDGKVVIVATPAPPSPENAEDDKEPADA